MSVVNLPSANTDDKMNIPPPEVLNFPSQIFEPIIQDLILLICTVIGVPASLPAAGILMLAAACVGRKRGIRLGNILQYANLFLLNITVSGIGKTPTIGTIFHRVNEKEFEWYQDYRQKLTLYNVEKRADKNLEEPVLEQITTDDSTTQALVRTLQANPAGVMLKADEIDGIFRDKKIEKRRFLSGYDSMAWKVNRVKEKLFVQAGTISIFGNITKSQLLQNFGPEDISSGLIPRFCFIFESKHRIPDFNLARIEEENYKEIVSITDNLLDLEFENKNKSIIIDCDDDATNLFGEWHDNQIDEVWDELKSEYYEMLPKHFGQCLRFALVLDCLQKATTDKPMDQPIGQELMEKAIILSNYLKVHKRKVYNYIYGIDVIQKLSGLQYEAAKAVVDLCKEEQVNTLTTSTITDELNRGRNKVRNKATPAAVGKTVSTFGLSKVRTDSGRSYEIHPHHIADLKARIKATEE